MDGPVGQRQQEQVIPLYQAGAIVWALNIGGPAIQRQDGIHFEADELSTAAVVGRIGEVGGTQDEAPYQSYREGELALSRGLPNGVYDITLFFAEPLDIPIGSRVFNVQAQGEPAIRQLDVRQATDGMPRSALTRTITGVAVRDGKLALRLQSVNGKPLLNALLVRSRDVDTRDWKQVWGDEFDYAGPPDPKKWNIEVWDARRVNDEDQAYTNRPKNVRVADGRLYLEAHRERHGDAAYTSGRIQSRGKGDWLYGRVDVRARLPGGQGTWPALWMLPSDPFRYATRCAPDPEDWQGVADCDAWPNSGEIDIMEHVGYDMSRLHGTVHNKAYYSGNHQQRKGSVEVAGLDQDFHVYSLEWNPELIRIYYDGIPYFSYRNEGEGWENWPYDHPYHLIMNLAIGGHWGRAGGPIDDSMFPVSLAVDYVRVFKPGR
jgi:beta-glucanase (GH16 family)